MFKVSRRHKPTSIKLTIGVDKQATNYNHNEASLVNRLIIKNSMNLVVVSIRFTVYKKKLNLTCDKAAEIEFSIVILGFNKERLLKIKIGT